MRGRDFSIHFVINLTDGLSPRLRRPNLIGRPLGLEILLLASCMTIWYQSVQVLSPAPPLPGGGLKGPPGAAGVPLPLVEAGLLPWRGAVDFPSWLGAVDFLPWPEAVDFPPWPEVDSCALWFGVDPCPLPLGAGWVLSGHFPEAPVAEVPVWAGLGGRG